MRSDIREKLTKAVNLIVNTQNSEGGWRYQPQRRDADISVTICQVMALRAARNAGLLRAARNDRPLHRVRQAQPERRRRLHVHAARGRPKRVSAVGRRRRGTVQRGHLRRARRSRRGSSICMEFLPRGNDFNRESHYFYGHYYAVQAMWHAGGENWGRWYPAIRDALVARQARGRLVDGFDLPGVRHRHGLHHPADAEQLSADLSAVAMKVRMVFERGWGDTAGDAGDAGDDKTH